MTRHADEMNAIIEEAEYQRERNKEDEISDIMIVADDNEGVTIANKMYNDIVSRENAKAERLKPLAEAVTGLFKRRKPNTHVTVAKGWLAKRPADREQILKAVRLEYSIKSYMRQCKETGEQYRLSLEMANGCELRLTEDLSYLLTNEPQLIIDMYLMGWSFTF